MAYCQFLQPPLAGADYIKFSEYLHARQRVRVTVHGLIDSGLTEKRIFFFISKLRKGNDMTKTEQNLLEAFAGESQANRRYLAFAKRAKKEGYPQVAKLFRAVAEAETVHALAHLRVLGQVKSTAENLKEAIEGETHEFTNMYPAMIDIAKEEGNKAAVLTFSYANQVEKVHAGLYQKALDNMAALEETDCHVCAVCGYTCENEPPNRCPVCGAKSQAFCKVD